MYYDSLLRSPDKNGVKSWQSCNLEIANEKKEDIAKDRMN